MPTPGPRYLGPAGEGIRTIAGSERVDPRFIMPIPETMGLGTSVKVDNPEAQPVTYSERAAYTLREKLWKLKQSLALAGLLDYLFDVPVKRTKNPITSAVLTTDKVILVSVNGSHMIDSIFGTEWEIIQCLKRMLVSVDATPEESDTLSYLLASKIHSDQSFTPPPGAVISHASVPRPTTLATYALVDEAGVPIPTPQAPPPPVGQPHEETAPGEIFVPVAPV